RLASDISPTHCPATACTAASSPQSGTELVTKNPNLRSPASRPGVRDCSTHSSWDTPMRNAHRVALVTAFALAAACGGGDSTGPSDPTPTSIVVSSGNNQ